MKCRLRTWRWWVELLLAALFPTVVLGPTAALGMLFLARERVRDLSSLPLIALMIAMATGLRYLPSLLWAKIR